MKGHPLRSLVCAAIAFAMAAPAFAEVSNCLAGHGFSDQEMLSTNLQQLDTDVVLDRPLSLEKIRIFQQDIFLNPKTRFYRELNKWHPSTKPATILSRLPFQIQKNDQVDQALVEEAERILRALPYFYDARVLVKQICATTVDLDVVVREVWTLTPDISISREGGESEYEIGIADTNWRGSGKAVSLAYEQKLEEERFELKYQDHPRRNRWLRSISTQIGPNAYRYAISIEQPFLATNTSSAVGVSATSARILKKLYVRGKELTRFDTTIRKASFYRAKLMKRASSDRRYARTYLGLRYLSEDLQPTLIHQNQVFTAKDEAVIYPFIGWESTSNRFAKLPHFFHLGRDEYINLGWNAYVELGYGQSDLPSDGSSIHFSYKLARRWLFDDQHIATANLNLDGRFSGHDFQPDNLISTLRTQYLHTLDPTSKLYVSVDLAHGRNLDHFRFFEIGGQTGMRGYPNHFQTGTRKYKLVMEYRYETSFRPLNLFALGFVGFAEIGKAWFSNPPEPWAHRTQHQILKDVGIGVRLHSLRTGSDQTIHLDLARPLTNHTPSSAYEVSFTVRRRFL